LSNYMLETGCAPRSGSYAEHELNLANIRLCSSAVRRHYSYYAHS
jgi:hypothetical protein